MTTRPPGVRLPVVPEPTATGTTRQLYDEIRTHFGLGLVPDIFKLVSTRPSYLRVFWEGYRSIFDEGVLDRGMKELIAAFVAREVAKARAVLPTVPTSEGYGAFSFRGAIPPAT